MVTYGIFSFYKNIVYFLKNMHFEGKTERGKMDALDT